MNYTENYKGVKIDVQAPSVEVGESAQNEIRNSIDKLFRFTQDINALDIYFKSEGQGGKEVNIVGMRVGIPGPDVFAEDRGDHPVALIKSITDKNIRQIQKGK
jgi:ribosome-associated translation inhibitor RaiA